MLITPITKPTAMTTTIRVADVVPASTSAFHHALGLRKSGNRARLMTVAATNAQNPAYCAVTPLDQHEDDHQERHEERRAFEPVIAGHLFALFRRCWPDTKFAGFDQNDHKQ